MRCHVCGEEVTGSYLEHMKKHQEKLYEAKPLRTHLYQELESRIKEAIIDEDRAMIEYRHLSIISDGLDLKEVASKLASIAGDEEKHRIELKRLLELI